MGGRLQDVWHVRRGGRLVFAEATRLDDVSKATLARPAVLGQATAVALLLLVAPDAEARLTAVRASHAARAARRAPAPGTACWSFDARPGRRKTCAVTWRVLSPYCSGASVAARVADLKGSGSPCI